MGIFDSINKAIFGEAMANTVAAPTAPALGAVVPPAGHAAPSSTPAGTAGGQSTASVGSAPMTSATTQGQRRPDP